tara:strand:- start:284 stop:526 length:243 start_codon:yes stop_codon:yes gene_type:complete
MRIRIIIEIILKVCVLLSEHFLKKKIPAEEVLNFVDLRLRNTMNDLNRNNKDIQNKYDIIIEELRILNKKVNKIESRARK